MLPDRYTVGKDGRVWLEWAGNFGPVRQHYNINGYPRIRVGRSPIRWYLVHHLVMFYHGPAKPSLWHIIEHLDGDKCNAHISNLKWSTQSENMRTMWRHRRERLVKAA